MPEASDSSIDYSTLGLVANPFAPTHQSSGDPYWSRLIVHAAVNRLHVALLGDQEDGRPVLVSMPHDCPDYYYTAAENAFLARTGSDQRLNALAVNVGLDMMRLGRIRGTLAEVAELVSAAEFDLTLAKYCAAVFAEPDTTIPAFDAIRDADTVALARAFEERPRESVAEIFGEDTYARNPDRNESDFVLREAYYRQSTLDPNPSETEDVPEEAEGETTSVMSPAVADDSSAALPGYAEYREAVHEEGAEEEPDETDRRLAIASYVIAYAKTHLSPVVARGLRAYLNDGTGALAHELKVTKAPKKTLKAIIKLARHRFDRFVVLYDRFDSWTLLDSEVRALVLGSLQELRWVLAEGGRMVVLAYGGQTPEIEEQFAAAEQVDWSMRGLLQYQDGRAYDADIAQDWIDSASAEPSGRLRVDSPAFASIATAAEGDMFRFAWMAAAAVDDAAVRGLRELDDEAVAAGLAAGDPPLED